MPRPKNNRMVKEPPLFSEFKPTGIAGKNLNQRVLNLDEFEAIRLADYLSMSHEEAAAEMNISRSTFTRLIDGARHKISNFLIKGELLTIDGGKIHFKSNIINCIDCGHMFKMAIEKPVSNCPSCSSSKLENLAGGFGHGNCCVNRDTPEKSVEQNARTKQKRT